MFQNKSTIALPGISALVFNLKPKGPRANVELPRRYTWLRDGGYVIIYNYSDAHDDGLNGI